MLTKKQRFWIDVSLIFIWIISINFHSGVAILSISSFLHMTGLKLNIEGNLLAEYWLAPTQFLESSLFGFFFGLAFVLVDRKFRNPKYSKMAFGKLIIRKSLFYAVSILLAFLTIYLILNTLGIYGEEVEDMVSFDAATLVLVLLIFFGITSEILFLNFLIQTIENTGFYNILRFSDWQIPESGRGGTGFHVPGFEKFNWAS